MKEIFNFLRENEEELKLVPHFYQIELNQTRKELIEMLYKLKEGLHPQFLFSTGRAGTLNDIKWLIKNEENFKSTKESDYAEFRYRLNHLSNSLSEMLFGEFADQPFENELVYQIASSTFRKMGIRSYFKDEEKRLLLDLTQFKNGMVSYKFVPWSSGIEKSLGKVLDEYYLENELRVDIGLKPLVFRSLSTGITTPVHETIHHISTLYTSGAYSTAIAQAFKDSFKDISIFKLIQDHSMLFGSIDNKLRDEMNKMGFDIRGKDLTDPFVFWEIVKRHGIPISDICDIPLNKLYEASYSYLSSYLPFRVLEEGVACYLAIKNADIERAPKEFAGLENSLKSLVSFGSKLRKLEYLERAIGFYTGEKELADYYIPELQLYPLSYLYIARKAEIEKPKDVRWYFDLIKNGYVKRAIAPAQRFIKRKKIEEVSPNLAHQRKIESLIAEMNQNIQNYRQRLDEVDRLLNEYRNQLNQLQSLRNYPSVSYQPYRRENELSSLLNSRRVRSEISPRMDDSELLRNVMYVAAGAIVSYSLARILNQYLSR
ncbi:MAG: hypothetical protein QMD12_03270 [Candidatus Aenigmarchaeota archaeon]|nr:hypothetical protein [Candidatus Aenigmarchaeota archaeon]